MLIHWLYPLHETFAFLNVIKYITFRSLGAALTALLICILFGDRYIRWLKTKQIGQSVRDDGPQSHFSKKGTPTMGGGLILGALTISVLLWGDWSNPFLWNALVVTLTLGAVGWVDDYRKVIKKNSKGLSAKEKFLGQWCVAIATMCFLYFYVGIEPELHFPFFKDWVLDLGPLYILFGATVIVGASNAVNLTDGLDGLASGPTLTTASTLLIFAYCAGHFRIAEYLQIPYVLGVGELSIFLAALAAATLGFLWFNTYPAQLFMGDVGSLAIGGALGVVSVMTRNELLLALVGGVFVMEALSVMIQVASFKMTGKRVFKMAPIHHHFELKGWPEPKVIVRFWILSILLSLLALSTLKLR